MKLTLDGLHIENMVAVLTLMQPDDPDVVVVAKAIAEAARSPSGDTSHRTNGTLVPVIQRVLRESGYTARMNAIYESQRPVTSQIGRFG